MRRLLALFFGIITLLPASQFPEFSQQYLQRLGGAVDELELQVEAFDKTAKAAGLTRERALKAISGGAFLEGHQKDMIALFERYETLSADYAVLKTAHAFNRLSYLAFQSRDAEITNNTLEDYKPAFPLTTAGFIFGGSGFLIGFLLFLGVSNLIFRRQ